MMNGELQELLFVSPRETDNIAQGETLRTRSLEFASPTGTDINPRRNVRRIRPNISPMIAA